MVPDCFIAVGSDCKEVFVVTLEVTADLQGDEFGFLRGKLDEFNEKPQATAGCISGGYFICNRGIMDYLSTNDDLVFEQEPIKNMVADQQVSVYKHNGFWQPMDTYRDYTYLNKLHEKNQAPWIHKNEILETA